VWNQGSDGIIHDNPFPHNILGLFACWGHKTSCFSVTLYVPESFFSIADVSFKLVVGEALFLHYRFLTTVFSSTAFLKSCCKVDWLSCQTSLASGVARH